MSRVFTIPNFLTNQECTQVVTKCISELNLQQAFISEDNKLNLKYRKSSIAFTNNIELIYKRLTEKLIKSIKVTGYSIADLEHFQFTEYQVGEFYKWHRDSQTDSPEPRIWLDPAPVDALKELQARALHSAPSPGGRDINRYPD